MPITQSEKDERPVEFYREVRSSDDNALILRWAVEVRSTITPELTVHNLFQLSREVNEARTKAWMSGYGAGLEKAAESAKQ